jgi:polyphosphate kinase 2 (PPK2 family)
MQAGIRGAHRRSVRQWKLSPMDLPARTGWYDYSRARDRMLAKTDTRSFPWYLVHSDARRRF